MADAVERITLSSGEQAAELQRPVTVWTTVDGMTIISDPNGVDMMRDINGDDLLQQAMNEVSAEYGRAEPGMLYSHDGSILSFDNFVSNGEASVSSLTPQADGDHSVLGTTCLQVTSDGSYAYLPSVANNDLAALANVVPQNCSTTISDNVFINSNCLGDATSVALQETGMLPTKQEGDRIEVTTSNVGLRGSVVDATAPLGSRGNPIRIVQRGNEFTSMQHLSSDQLSQILQVIQQQQLLQTAKQSGSGQAVLYNPDSQTCVVYRVLSPESELPVAEDRQDSKTLLGSGLYAPDHQSRRVYRKRKRDDDDKVEGFELSRQEKEERKKHRPRTRSGRVSRPPQYMVKDYKHIHPVDYDEDYDDSDGGYSDFKHSGDEDDMEDKLSKDGSFIEYELSGGGRLKQNKCETCDKKYIGRGGLARHYRLNPTHGKIQDADLLESTSTDFTATSDAAESNKALFESTSELAEGSSVETQIETETVEPCQNIAESIEKIVSDQLIVGASNASQTTAFKKRGRGRPPVHQQGDRRKARLKELIRQSSQEELLGIVVPRVVKSSSLWQFLLAMTDPNGDSQRQIAEILCQYNEFTSQVKDVCHQRLSKVDEDQQADSKQSRASEDSVNVTEGLSQETVNSIAGETDSTITRTRLLQINDADVARCLGFEVGRYKFEDRIHRSDRSKAQKDDVPISAMTSAPDTSNTCADSSMDDVSVLNASSYSNAENLSTEPLELSTIDTDGEHKEDLSKTIDSDLDAFQYVLNNDNGCRSMNDLSNGEVDEPVMSSFESAQYGSSAVTCHVYGVVNDKSDTSTAAVDCQELGNISNAASSSRMKLDLASRSSNDNVPSDLELLADSFVTTNGIVFCSDLGSSANCVKTSESEMDVPCNGAELGADFHNHEHAFKSDGASSSMFNDVNAEESGENNLTLDVVEALFANSLSNRT